MENQEVQDKAEFENALESLNSRLVEPIHEFYTSSEEIIHDDSKPSSYDTLCPENCLDFDDGNDNDWIEKSVSFYQNFNSKTEENDEAVLKDSDNQYTFGLEECFLSQNGGEIADPSTLEALEAFDTLLNTRSTGDMHELPEINQSSEEAASSTYKDYARVTDEEAGAHLKYPNMRGRAAERFPVKLHQIVERSEVDGYSSIISWTEHGRAFKICNTNLFIQKVMPRFFFQTKMASFIRQLGTYGFHKIVGKNNPDKGNFYHELFLRGRPGLCNAIVRNKKRSLLDPENEPNFTLLEPMTLFPQLLTVETETIPEPVPSLKEDIPRVIRYSENAVATTTTGIAAVTECRSASSSGKVVNKSRSYITRGMVPSVAVPFRNRSLVVQQATASQRTDISLQLPPQTTQPAAQHGGSLVQQLQTTADPQRQQQLMLPHGLLQSLQKPGESDKPCIVVVQYPVMNTMPTYVQNSRSTTHTLGLLNRRNV